MNNKEILIGYISSFGEDRCKLAYKILKDEFDSDRTRVKKFNGNGIEDKTNGLVRLRQAQYKRLLKEYGEDGTRWLISVLFKYIKGLKERVEAFNIAEDKARLRRYITGTHYMNLTRGWVIDKYKREYKEKPKKRIHFDDITNEQQAIDYINQEGVELLIDTPELQFLVCKFDKIKELIYNEIK